MSEGESGGEKKQKPTCFVAMPIMTPDLVGKYQPSGGENHFAYVLDNLFRPAITEAGYDVAGPLAADGLLIHASIIRNLIEAEMVLCDMSTRNPNVFLEFGIRIALNKPVALVVEDEASMVPFDSILLSHRPYDTHIKSWILKTQIKELAEFINAVPKGHNELWKYFGLTQKDAGGSPPDGSLEDLYRMVGAAVQDGLDRASQPSPSERARLSALLDTLNVDEREILKLLALGLRRYEVAERLGMEPSAVRRHGARILLKLGVEDYQQATSLAIKAGILRDLAPPPPRDSQ